MFRHCSTEKRKVNMAIFYNYTITVNGGKASLDKDIYLYKNNKNIDYYFSINNADFNFKDVESDKIIKPPYASIKILNPSGKKIMTKKANIENGKVHLKITEDMIDEITEVGTYTFQIDLYDGESGRVSIPPVYDRLHILEPLFEDEDAVLIDEETI